MLAPPSSGSRFRIRKNCESCSWPRSWTIIGFGILYHEAAVWCIGIGCIGPKQLALALLSALDSRFRYVVKTLVSVRYYAGRLFPELTTQARVLPDQKSRILPLHHPSYDDMRRLEESVLELRDMFLFLAAIVDNQAETLDSIELHVENTKEYTGQAVEHLQHAQEYQEDLQRKKMCMRVLICVSLVVLVVVLLCALGPCLNLFKR